MSDQHAHDGEEEFYSAITNAYEKVVTWRRNLFNVPFGASGKAFVDELATLIKGFADGTTIRKIAWKAVCVACHVLLQRPNETGSSSAYAQHLNRRMSLWKSGRALNLLHESISIHEHLPQWSKRKTRSQSDTVFSKLVFNGKIQSGIQYISEDSSGCLRMDDKPMSDRSTTVQELLQEKHPEAKSPPAQALVQDELLPINPIVFDRLTPDLIKDVGRHASGSAGPSGLDAEAWKRMLTCFKQSSDHLCNALAAAAYCLCTEDLTGQDLSAFTASRLIPLDKKPGVRPIAVGEVFRRIIYKSVLKVIERDILQATVPLQNCVGVPSACEAAIHAMD